MAERFFIGLDLGQQYDYTAMVVVGAQVDKNRVVQYFLHWAYRFPLKMPYPRMVKAVAGFLNQHPIKSNYSLIVDYTGVGAPVFDMLSKENLRPVAFTITGGKDASVKNRYKVNVPKTDVVNILQVVVQNQLIRIPKSLKVIEQLKKEIQNFSMKISGNATTSFGALKSDIHDDLVMSLAMALWYGELTLVGKRSPFIRSGK